MVIIGKHILHSAFYLAVTLLCVAIYFVMLRAEYLAAVQILVYIGSVIVMILFALMLTRTKVGDETNISNNQKIFASLVSLILFVSLSVVFYYSNIKVTVENTASLKIISIKEFANILFSKYSLPFEVASVLLLAALVGSVVLAMRERDESNSENNLDSQNDSKSGNEVTKELSNEKVSVENDNSEEGDK